MLYVNSPNSSRSVAARVACTILPLPIDIQRYVACFVRGIIFSFGGSRMVERLRDCRGLFLCQEKSFEYLLKYPVVSDWIDSYTASNTRRNYLRALHVICASSGLNPTQLLGDRDENAVSAEVKSMIRRIAQKFLKRDRPAMARSVVVAAKSFFVAQDKVISFTRKERSKN